MVSGNYTQWSFFGKIFDGSVICVRYKGRNGRRSMIILVISVTFLAFVPVYQLQSDLSFLQSIDKSLPGSRGPC